MMYLCHKTYYDCFWKKQMIFLTAYVFHTKPKFCCYIPKAVFVLRPWSREIFWAVKSTLENLFKNIIKVIYISYAHSDIFSKKDEGGPRDMSFCQVGPRYIFRHFTSHILGNFTLSYNLKNNLNYPDEGALVLTPYAPFVFAFRWNKFPFQVGFNGDIHSIKYLWSLVYANKLMIMSLVFYSFME